MAKNGGDQLSFDMSPRPQGGVPTARMAAQGNVVTFVDASTKASREEAVRRVSRAGIFSVAKANSGK